MVAEILTKNNLNFHKESSTYSSHALHAFAAKFPPQVPKTFILELTSPGENVLDPMNGSGTTTLESYLLQRKGVGVDIDPIAVKIARVKLTPLQIDGIKLANKVIGNALHLLRDNLKLINEQLEARFDLATKKFINYWFLPNTQQEILSLILSIEQYEENSPIRNFLEVILSSIIVTKSGGVSLARDLAHTRPHLDKNKRPRNAIEMFSLRLQKYAPVINTLPDQEPKPIIINGDAKQLGLKDNSIHLVVTSPPYANAIDYMRAHKFSLVWFNKPINELSMIRKTYVGSEAMNGFKQSNFPFFTEQVLNTLGEIDSRKENVLRKYFYEMRKVLSEIYRVLVPGKYAVIVVGTSTMRGIDVKTPHCLANIAEHDVSFKLIGIKTREIDRDRRMLPVSGGFLKNIGIEKRMHTEEIILLEKPI
jgi:DNA modification methylase